MCRYDKEEAGEIGPEELHLALSELNLKGKANAATLISMYDADGNGRISLVEFSALVRDVKASRLAVKKAKSVFSQYDRDGSGSISADELRPALRALGIQASPEEVQAVLNKYDKDGNQTIDLEEFETLVREHQEHANMRRPPSLSLGSTLRSPAPPPTPQPTPQPAPQPTPQPATQPATQPSAGGTGSHWPAGPVGAAAGSTMPTAAPLSVDDAQPAALERPSSDPLAYQVSYPRVVPAVSPAASVGASQDVMDQLRIIAHTKSMASESKIGEQLRALALVTNQLVHEVARLRPEYWQMAHQTTMAAPTAPFALPTPGRSCKPRRTAVQHLLLPTLEGPLTTGPAADEHLGLSRGHPIAYPHDFYDYADY